jgi:DNA repair protein RecO (recombination protein O)
MVGPYLSFGVDLGGGAYASYCAELLDRFTAEGDQDYHDLFSLFDDTLGYLCSDDDPRLAVRYYEIHLLDAVGFRPELSECVVSREAVKAEDQFFSYALGGVVSAGHGHEGMSAVPIAMTTLKLLRHMQRSPYSHVKTVTVSPELHDAAERVLLGYITYVLERKLQSVDFIRRIRA